MLIGAAKAYCLITIRKEKETKMKRVLITGAAGNLGGKLAQHLRGRYALRLLDQRADAADEVIGADLSHWVKGWVQQFEGVDAVVHLAANPNPTPPWADLLASNLDSRPYSDLISYSCNYRLVNSVLPVVEIKSV